VIDYGAALISVRVPDKSGRVEEITLCFDTLDMLLSKDNPYFACTVGRYANRIANGEFDLDGKKYHLAKTFRGQSSHGGVKGWNFYIWTVVESGVRVRGGVGEAFVTMRHVSPDGDEGFPGTVTAQATYSLAADGVVAMEFFATVEGAATPINMANHCYYNLSGRHDGLPHARDHTLQLFAEAFVEVDASTQIPTGTVKSVAEAPAFSFLKPRRLDEDLDRVSGGEQVRFVPVQLCRFIRVHTAATQIGYDHSWVVSPRAVADPTLQADTVSLASRYGVEAARATAARTSTDAGAGAPALSAAGEVP
jgi:aldose 1-epimerase